MSYFVFLSVSIAAMFCCRSVCSAECPWYYPAVSTYILNTHCCSLSAASYGSAICDCDKSDGRCISLSSVESKMKKLSALLKKVDGEVHAEMVCVGSKYFPTCMHIQCTHRKTHRRLIYKFIILYLNSRGHMT